VSPLDNQSPSSSSRVAAIQSAREILANSPVYLDTETTGLDSNAEIIEIAVIDSDGSILMNSLVRPRNPIPREATRIHGITDEMTRTSPTWISLWQEVRGIFFGRQIAVYNADFDLRMIDQTNRVCGLSRWQPGSRPVDIMKIFAGFRSVWDPIRNENRYFRLEEAGKHLGITIPNSHRALDDAQLARELLIQIASQSN
jgi:DNA polymerase-3 subunit epsilon